MSATKWLNANLRRTSSPSSPTSSRLTNWVPTNLHVAFLLTFFAFVSVCIGALQALDHASSANSGLRTIKVQKFSDYLDSITINSSIGSVFSGLYRGAFFYGYGGTVTANIISVLWAGVVADLLTRQPYIELAKEGGSLANRTISLDYQAHMILKRLWKLIANGHVFCLFAIVIGWITSFVISPLSSSLFVTLPFVLSEDVALLQTSTFVGNTDFSKISVGNTINLAASILAYNTTPPVWSDSLFAFDSFKPADTSLFQNGALASAMVKAYAGTLSCQNVVSPVMSTTVGGFNFAGNDRGCSIQVPVDSAGSGLFVHVKAQSCSSSSSTVLPSESTSMRRLVFAFAQQKAGSNPINTTLISCIPYYSVSSALVTINATTSELIQYEIIGEPKDLQNNLTSAASFEQQLPLVYVTDPSAAQSVDAYGNLIVQVFQSTHQDLFNGDSLVRSLPATFSAIFAQTTLAFFTQKKTIRMMDGLKHTDVLRLCTYKIVVRMLQGFLTLVACTIIVAIVYPYIHPVRVKASGQSILDRGMLLYSSNLMQDTRLSRGKSAFSDFAKDDETTYTLHDGTVRVQRLGHVSLLNHNP